MSTSIHTTAKIAEGVHIGHGVVVGEYAQIGPGCRLDPYAVIGPHTFLGASNHVSSFAVVGAAAQDRRTPPDAPFRLICGDGNIFREGCTISRGTSHGGGSTLIGSGNLFMAHSHVGHDSRLGDENVLANGVSLAGHVSMEHRVTLGGHAGVHQFSRIGELAFVAANAMVSQDIPPYCLAAGDRARLIGLNETGLERADMPTRTRRALREAFKGLLFPGDTSRAERSQKALRSKTAEVRHLAQFILQSDRGVAAVGRRRSAKLDG